MRIPKSKVLYVSAAAVALIGGSVATAGAAYKTVTVQDNGQRRTIRGFTFGNVASFLSQHHIEVQPGDRVTPRLDSPVVDGMVVDIARPVTVTLVDGGMSVPVQTYAATVADLLREQGIALGPDDRLLLDPATKLTDGITIKIRRMQKQVFTKLQDIPFQTIRQRTDSLFVGEQRVLTRGVKGSLQVVTTSIFVNGRKVGESVTRRVVQHPVDEVIAVGTRPRPYTLSARGVGSLVVLRQLTVVATAYAAGGRTATGHLAQPGVVAVDPRVIPLGTKLYIPGLGIVYAEDTGGAIDGYRIDICMSSRAAAEQWGVRTITIYEVQ